MTSKSGKPTDPSNGQLFVYGLDEAGKPKGARFPASEAEKVLPVATAMNLRCSQAEVFDPGLRLGDAHRHAQKIRVVVTGF